MSPVEEKNAARLRELCSQRLSQRRLIFASNRGPIEYSLTEDKRLQARRSGGGMVSVLRGISSFVELDWVASAMGEGDRQAVQRAQGGRIKVPIAGEKLYLRFVVTPRNAYHKFYSVICNPLLWFLQHHMWNLSYTPNIGRTVYDAWENGYVPVNQAFAQAVIDEVVENESPPIILLNDYHLYLAGAYIRSRFPNLVIQHFTHIPWPEPCYWQLLPDFMRHSILRSLCASDIVGLQTKRDVHSFLHCCQTLIDGADVDHEQQTVRIDEHVVQVKAYPISIDVAGLKKLASSPKLQEYEEKLRPLYGEQTIVRVDRAEPSKNILRGFKAFDTLLERYPQFLGKVKFIAFLVPTRTHIGQYQRYTQEVMQLIDEINSKYGTENWHPIDYFYENNYLQAIGGMRSYDVLLVNGVIDGMSLVAKEGPTVNTRDGVVILSETIGACEQLGKDALKVAPADLEGTTQALYAALTMPIEEKKRHAAGLRKAIEEEDITNWLFHLLEDAANMVQQRSGTAT